VAKAVNGLPEEFGTKLENIDVVIESWPIKAQLPKARLRRSETLLGLCEGVPQPKRSYHYGLVTPDKITIFQKPIEAKYRHEIKIPAEIQRVVRHEIAHHFGIRDTRLKQIETDS
jgi:predicted Zn-dependent protease with MMP-like domain